MNEWGNDQQPVLRRRMANGLRLGLACVGLVLLAACQFPFSPTPTPTPYGSDAEIELVSGKAWARPAGGDSWTEFHGHLSLLFNDRIRVPREETLPAELRLPDGTTVRLDPGTILQLLQSPRPESRPVFRLVQGRIAVIAASSDQLFDIYISATEAFIYESLNFVVDSQQAGTAFQLWAGETTAHIAMGAEGLVEVYTAEDKAVLEPEWEAWTELDREIHVVKPRPTDTPTPTETSSPTPSSTPTATATATSTPTVEPTPTATLTPTVTPTLTLPTPTPTPTPTTTPTPTRAAPSATPTPVDTPPTTPTVEATVALPQVYESPLLLEPPSNKVFGFDKQQSISLLWLATDSLAAEHWYEVQLWQEDEEPTGRYWAKENWWEMGPEYYPGDYYWQVVIVQGKGDSVVGAVSPPSETRYFQWIAVAPTPVPGPKPTSTPVPPPTNTPVPPPPTNTPGPPPTNTPRPRTPTP